MSAYAERLMCAIEILEPAHDLAVEAVDDAQPTVLDEPHRALLARLEADRGARRDVEAIAARRLALEQQRGVRLVKVIMRADLHRPVAAVLHLHLERRAADVQRDVGA